MHIPHTFFLEITNYSTTISAVYLSHFTIENDIKIAMGTYKLWHFC